MPELPRVFQCIGLDQVWATELGELALVELVELSGHRMTLAISPKGAKELIYRLLVAAELAETRKTTSQGYDDLPDLPAPLITDHNVEVSSDPNILVLTLRLGSIPYRYSVHSPSKIRESLEKAEKEAEEKRRLSGTDL